MTDFWPGFWVYLLAFTIPIFTVMVGWIFGAWPETSGRYGAQHLRWFKWSLIFNVCGWIVTGALWIATANYFSTLQAQSELALWTHLTAQVNAQFAIFTTQMQTIEDSALAAEDALTKWYDRTKETP